MVQRRPGLMAFPSGDIMRRSPVGGVTLNVGAQPEIVRQPTTVTESMIGAPGSGIPAVTFDQVMARQAAARQMLAQATAQRQQREQQQQMGGPFLPARPEGMPGISPRGRGALAGALAGLQYAGPQTQPTSFAQGLGVMGQAAMEAYDRATTAQAEQEALEFEKLYKIADLDIKAAKATGGMFKGSGFKPGAFNMIIDLAPKIKAGTATPAEEQAYSLAYGEVSAPTTKRFFDKDGNETIETIPGANLSQFPKPAGFVEPTATVKPSPESIRKSKFGRNITEMGGLLNKYRNMIMSDDFGRDDIVSGTLGTPTKIMADASALATVLRLKIKELEDLGALVGGDFQILDSLLMNPASVVALKAGKTAMVAQIDQLERQMQSKLASNEQPQAEGMYLSPIVITKRSEWDDVPIGSFVQLPDGRLVYKEK